MGQHIGGVVQPLYKTSLINDANLVSYWRLKDNANDYKGTNNGTATSVSFSPDYGKFGNYGQGASFNGSTSNIVLTSTDSLKPSSTLSISVWIKSINTGVKGVFINTSWNNPNYYGYILYTVSGKARFYIENLTTEKALSSNTTVTDGIWHHICCVWDGSYIYVYVDGRLDSTPLACSSIGYASTMYPRIGCANFSPSQAYDADFFDGKIDDLSLFNRALTSSEVLLLATGCQNKELYATSFINDDNLVSYWRFEGNSNDSKGSNNGTDTSITYGTNYGKFGQGANFNGTSSFITLVQSNDLNIVSSITISSWFKLASTTNQCFIVQNYNTISGNLYGYQVQILNHKAVGILRHTTSSSVIFGNTNVDDNNWHHLVVTSTGDILNLFIDGKSDASSVSVSGDITYYSTMFPAIGMEMYVGPTTVNLFNGSLDDVAVFNRALTAREVKQLYRQTPHSDVVKLNR